MGVVWALTSGYWPMLGFTILGVAGQLAARPRAVSTAGEVTDIEFREGRVWLDGRRLPIRLALWTREQRTTVFDHLVTADRQVINRVALEDLDRDRRISSSPQEQVRLGVSQGRFIALDWSCRPHTLIVGPTGSGKSALLSGLLADLASIRQSDPSIRIWFADYKSGQTIAENAASCRSFVCSGERHHRMWNALAEELDRAEPDLRARHVLVIEELGAALAQRPTAELIQSLAAQGRSKGLRIIATNQSVSGLPRGLLVNLGNRVVLQGTDDAERLLLGGTSIDRNRGQNQASAQEFRTGAAHVSQVFAASLLPNDQHFEFIRYWST